MLHSPPNLRSAQRTRTPQLLDRTRFHTAEAKPLRYWSRSVAQACIGLAVLGRPIGPWPRRTGAPEASGTGRDRNLGPCWVRGAPGPQGHERRQRSPAAKRSSRSAGLQLKQLGRRQLSGLPNVLSVSVGEPG
jgi:hypothetical protein